MSNDHESTNVFRATYAEYRKKFSDGIADMVLPIALGNSQRDESEMLAIIAGLTDALTDGIAKNMATFDDDERAEILGKVFSDITRKTEEIAKIKNAMKSAILNMMGKSDG